MSRFYVQVPTPAFFHLSAMICYLRPSLPLYSLCIRFGCYTPAFGHKIIMRAGPGSGPRSASIPAAPRLSAVLTGPGRGFIVSLTMCLPSALKKKIAVAGFQIYTETVTGNAQYRPSVFAPSQAGPRGNLRLRKTMPPKK